MISAIKAIKQSSLIPESEWIYEMNYLAEDLEEDGSIEETLTAMNTDCLNSCSGVGYCESGECYCSSGISSFLLPLTFKNASSRCLFRIE